jgi:hypothetical protein
VGLADELINYIFSTVSHPLATTFAEWLATSSRFRAFADTYRDKIRKKVRGIQEPGGYQDLYAELCAAFLLLQDRRCLVEYEKYGVGKQRAPDLTVTFKTHTRFNMEVTRLRLQPVEPDREMWADPDKLVNMLCDKLGQLPPSISNVIFLMTEEMIYSATDLQASLSFLRERAIQKDDAFFARRNLNSARDFYRQQLRLSAVLIYTPQPASPTLPITLWLNPQTKHPLPANVQNLLRSLA